MKMFKTSTVKVPVDLGGRKGKKGILLVGSSVQSVYAIESRTVLFYRTLQEQNNKHIYPFLSVMET